MAFADFLRTLTVYKLYVLILCLLAFLLNQLDRYLLPVMSMHIAQDLKYGDKGCVNSAHFNKSVHNSSLCTDVQDSQSCDSQYYFQANVSVCRWTYTGQGIEYQIIAGPVFIVVYTLCGVFISYLTVYFRRRSLLAFFLAVWSLFTALSGLSRTYWQLALTRFGLGIGEAGCTPFAAALIGELFPAELRGSALGIYNFGIYFGYSMSYAFGNFLYEANIQHEGWRWVFYISAMLAIPIIPLIAFTIKEQAPQTTEAVVVVSGGSGSSASDEDVDETVPLVGSSQQQQTATVTDSRWQDKLKQLILAFLSPPLLLLCLAGSIRNAGGYVWAVNTQLFFQSQQQTSDQIGSYMSWIPLVGGSLGAFFGGFISDRVVKGRGVAARMVVLAVSQICAAPFALMALLLPPPAAYLMLIPSNIIGEMWIGVCLTCVLELVPVQIRAASVGYYLFIITNIGGNIPLLVPPLKAALSELSVKYAFRNSLIVLFPGMYALSTLLFLLTILVYKMWTGAVRTQTTSHTE